MRGIFQFLTEPAAQTTLQRGPLGHDLCFSIVSGPAVVHHSFLRKNFLSSLSLPTHLQLTLHPNNHLHRFSSTIWGYLHSPSCDPSFCTWLFVTVLLDLSAAHSLVQNWGCSFPRWSLAFSPQSSNAWFLFHNSHEASKVAISTPNCHQLFILFFFFAFDKSNFCLFGFRAVLFSFWGIHQVLNTFSEVKWRKGFTNEDQKSSPSSLICLNSSFTKSPSCLLLA